MSGGHFDYAYFRISEIADALKRELEANETPYVNEFGDQVGHQYAPETVEALVKCQTVLQIATEIARDVEWLYSDDCGEDTFLGKIQPLLKQLSEGL